MQRSRLITVPVISGYHEGVLRAQIIKGCLYCSGWWHVSFPNAYTGLTNVECFRKKQEVREFIRTCFNTRKVK